MFNFKNNRARKAAEAEARRDAMAKRAAKDKRRAELMQNLHRSHTALNTHEVDDTPSFIKRRGDYDYDYSESPHTEPKPAEIPANLHINDQIVDANKYAGRKEIVSVSFGPDVKIIAESAFEGCPNLRTLTFSEGLREIGPAAFANLPKLENFSLPHSLETLSEPVGYCDNNGRSIRPPSFMQKNSSRFGSRGSFENCPRITHVDIPNGVHKIGECTFSNCINLESATLPPNVSIDSAAFAGCTKLTAIDFSRGVKSIGVKAFSRTGLREVTLPGLVDVAALAFSDCPSLTHVSVSGSTRFDAEVFKGSRNIQSVACPEKSDLRLSLFRGCPLNPETKLKILRNMLPDLPEDAAVEKFDGVKHLVIPEGVTAIAPRAFAYEPELEKVELPSTLLLIGDESFDNARNLYSVTFNHNLIHIGARAFRRCSLDLLIFPDSLKTIGDSAFEHNPVIRADFPKALRSIGAKAFSKTELPILWLYDGIETIGKAAFSDSAIGSAVLPNDLTRIEAELFAGCKDLYRVHWPANPEFIAQDAFEGTLIQPIEYNQAGNPHT